jgi:hypothetical protein
LEGLMRTARISLVAAAALALLSACSDGGGVTALSDVALSEGDVPSDWAPADLADEEGLVLWAALPQFLQADADTHLFLHAYQGDSGRQGLSTMLIDTNGPAALPRPAQGGDDVLGPLGRLLEAQDTLLLREVDGGDPGDYFAASDLPADSLRSRLVRLVDGDRVFSDSAIFARGDVFVIVTVWYREEDGPYRELDDLATEVEERLSSYLTNS